MLYVEGQRARWEVQRCDASLGEVAELVTTADAAPFVVDQQLDLVRLRVQLRGGRRVLFGHDHFHLERCPWCTEQEQWTVRHLLRDCVVWEEERMEAWGRARQVAVAAGVTVAGGTLEQHREMWYLLMCGAAVDNDFIGLGLDTATHFARGKGVPGTRHLRVAADVYSRLLRVTGVFLRVVVQRTRELLEAGNADWTYAPAQHRRRVVINHVAREEAAAAADVDGQSDSDGAGGNVGDEVRRAMEALEAGDEDGAAGILRGMLGTAEGRRIIQDALGEDGDLDLDAILEEFGRTG